VHNALIMNNELDKQVTVAFRIPEWARLFYEQVAARERRNLSQVLRIVLEDHAKGLCGRVNVNAILGANRVAEGD
jgi:hypothetical protein